jgi:hypothetical protein
MRQWASCRLRGDVGKRRLVPFQTKSSGGAARRRAQANSTSPKHKTAMIRCRASQWVQFMARNL